ncbi:MAG: ABC transporter permease [Acidimicrobiales bacterium]
MTGRPGELPRRRWSTVVAAAVLLAAVALAVTGPWLAPNDPAQSLGRPFDPEGVGLLGTEALGRDLWSRLLHGGRRLVFAPLLITLASTLVGTVVGVLRATDGRAVRALRLIDIVAVLPPLVVVLVLLYRFGGSLLVIGLAVIITSVPIVSRYTRAVARPILQSGYVLQARLMGDPRHVILVRDIAPNLVGPAIADSALRLSGTFYVVTAAGFLGFGTSGSIDWAAMIQQNLAGAKLNPLAVAAPALAIAALTVPLNVLGDRLAARLAR